MARSSGPPETVDLRDGRRPDDLPSYGFETPGSDRTHEHKGGELVWWADPVELALEGSRRRRRSAHPVLPEPFCLEVGRRMLLAQLQWPDWVLRRVEKANFDGDRCVHRKISLELLVPADAPVFHGSDGKDYWLVPLSTMRRRTLVDFHLDDEEHRSISMLGIRLGQQLDESVLLAAAATASNLREDDQPLLQDFIREVVAGRRDDVMRRRAEWEGRSPRPEFLEPLIRDPLFRSVLARLWKNFTLYVFLPVEKGRHRVLWMSFDEPTEWRYRRPCLSRAEGSDEYVYVPEDRARVRDQVYRLMAAFGILPVRVRFLTPGAENAASYHFELDAPAGLHIVQASLVAGRPNDPERHVSADHVVGHSPTLGLHAVEVPPGSLSRAQVDVRVPTSGWLTTLLLSCALVTGVMGTVAYHSSAAHIQSWSNDKITNVVVILITVSAGFATLIAQREIAGTGARMLTTLRALGVLSLSLPVVMSGFLIYGGERMQDGQRDVELLAINVLTAAALIIAVLVLAAWIASWQDQRRRGVLASPWDMTTEKASEALTDLNVALRRYGFGTPAIGVESAEGWHERYFWTDEDQVMAVARLEDLGRRSVPVERTGGCSRLRSAGVHSATCARECAAVTPAHASTIPT